MFVTYSTTLVGCFNSPGIYEGKIVAAFAKINAALAKSPEASKVSARLCA